jgi:hypothetical protein
MTIPEATQALSRIRTALQPTATSIRDFVLFDTRINGKPFRLKHHEYQEKILEEYSKPDIDLVAQGPQTRHAPAHGGAIAHGAGRRENIDMAHGCPSVK